MKIKIDTMVVLVILCGVKHEHIIIVYIISSLWNRDACGMNEIVEVK